MYVQSMDDDDVCSKSEQSQSVINYNKEFQTKEDHRVLLTNGVEIMPDRARHTSPSTGTAAATATATGLVLVLV